MSDVNRFDKFEVPFVGTPRDPENNITCVSTIETEDGVIVFFKRWIKQQGKQYAIIPGFLVSLVDKLEAGSTVDIKLLSLQQQEEYSKLIRQELRVDFEFW